MKKALLILIGFAVISGFIFGDLQDIYKKGKITLKESDNFGNKTKWEEYFYDKYKWITVTPGPNPSIFIADRKNNSILKFNKSGNFQKKFGRKGLGPADINGPQNLSLLDGKYLVVRDDLSYRRITIWNLEGNFVDVVKTSQSPYNATAISKNKIAFWYPNQFPNKGNGYTSKYQIIIKDIKTRKEKVIREITLLDRSNIDLGRGMTSFVGNFFGEVFLVQTIEGNLAVGVSNSPEIIIYSPNGEVVQRFNLKITPIPASGEYIKRFKAFVIEGVKEKIKETTDETRKWWYKQDLRVFPGYDFLKIFDKYLPLYYEIQTDSEGNILVFKVADCFKDCSTMFQVYSSKGEFICETKLDKGDYELYIGRRFKNICFTSDGIIGYGMEKGDEDETYRLFKSNY